MIAVQLLLIVMQCSKSNLNGIYFSIKLKLLAAFTSLHYAYIHLSIRLYGISFLSKRNHFEQIIFKFLDRNYLSLMSFQDYFHLDDWQATKENERKISLRFIWINISS